MLQVQGGEKIGEKSAFIQIARNNMSMAIW